MMRVLVCGGRDYNDSDRIWNVLTELSIEKGVSVIIHGAATGADTQAMIWAQTMGKKHAPFAADWHKHGKAAGPIRNSRMIAEGRPDLVIAFPGGRGTADMVSRARKAGIEVREFGPPVLVTDGDPLPSTERVAAARPLGIGQREEGGCRDA